MAKKFKGVISVHGRRWFQKTYGNTYHSVSITMPDGSTHYVGMTYGYGDQYQWTAYKKVLEVLKTMPREYHKGVPIAPWTWAEENGYKWIVNVTDVTRKKDL